ncbi:MAG: hypothetical protein ABSG50_12865 [Opitutaceae bacterium]
MQKPTSAVSFLLTLTACVLFVLGIISAVMVYKMNTDIIDAFPSLKLDRSTAVWAAGWVFLAFYVMSLILAALAQIVDSTATSASHAETQTEHLRQIVAHASSRTPGVDDIARKVAGEIRVQARPQ